MTEVQVPFTMSTTSYLSSPIALVAPMKQKQTSLLTSALGEKPIVHPFLSSCPTAAAPTSCIAQGDGGASLLDQWDKAWMGSVSDSHMTGNSPSSQSSTAGNSPRGGDHTTHGPLTPSRLGSSVTGSPAAHAAASSSSPVSIGGPAGKSTTPSAHDGRVPPLPATPPPAHRPLANGTGAAGIQRADSGDVKATSTPGTPDGSTGITTRPVDAESSKHQEPAAQSTSSSLARPINVHHCTIPKGAKGPNDFASVFFSPLPYSYLNMARSDSTDQLLVNSVGSPDITLRNGRLAATTTITHVEWPVDVSASVSQDLSTLTAMDSTEPLPLLPEEAINVAAMADSVAAMADVTEHGTKRRGASSNGMTLVQQTLAQSRLHASTSALDVTTEDEEAADAAKDTLNPPTSTSPDSVLSADAAVEVVKTVSNGTDVVVSSRITTTATVTSTTVNAATTVVRTVHLGSSMGSDASILIRSSSPRPHSPSPAFSTHPAVAGVPALSPLTRLPGVSDHLKGTGYQSIAAALETQTQSLRSLRLVAAAAMIPHVDKADKGGEDAYCIVDVGLGAIGVADGVSGWAEEGIDPAEYSRTLMRFCADALEEASTQADAREVIRYAHKSTVMPGSSTVCLGVMKPCGRLQVANLGDSGVRVVRDGRIIFASTAQQHMFNMPYQLSHPSIIDSPDDADSADVTTIDVLPGDIVIMATDGLYDNMFDDEIAAICYDVVSRRRRALLLGNAGDAAPSREAAEQAAANIDTLLYTVAEAEALAVQITRTAHRYAQNPYQRTPWSVASCEQGYSWARYFAKGGGKMDDCTVIVSFVQADKSSDKEP